MKTINLGIKKPVKVGNSFYLSIPIAFIHYGFIEKGRSYRVLLEPIPLCAVRNRGTEKRKG